MNPGENEDRMHLAEDPHLYIENNRRSLEDLRKEVNSLPAAQRAVIEGLYAYEGLESEIPRRLKAAGIEVEMDEHDFPITTELEEVAFQTLEQKTGHSRDDIKKMLGYFSELD